MQRHAAITPALGAALAALLLLSGCAGAAGAAPGGAAPTAAAEAAASVTVEEAWVKAADDGMTALFGNVVNGGAADVTLVGASTDAAETAELHETVESDGTMQMRQKEGGFELPAGEAFALEPGANHVMLMGLTGPAQAGDEVTVTLEFSDGSTLDVTAPVKDYAGANEQYDDGHEAH
ncbi:copper chaperone PCu(A)C [Agromyces italicus]|uniref:copper chaperone PCu(A)C n=1 Tax=Agromyces italicus TaxID=279572 RepID=UPI0003B76494|nr:copper chaperone PCu(A)C [Agromyces italicus]